MKGIKIVGVDDFAFRRGKRYGIILVDLEAHQPVALLKDRKAETLTEWLEAHKSIEILSRDRSKTYASGMAEGAPEAMQVADRFHLVQNFAEILERVFSRYEKELKAIEGNRQGENLGLTQKVIITPQPTATEKARAKTEANHQRRVEQQQQIKQLHEQQWPADAIAQEVGVSVRTVRRSVTRPDLPSQPPRRRSFGRSLLDPYKSQIIEWFNTGLRDSGQLMILLKQKGYRGGIRTLQHYLSSLRHSQGITSKQGRMPKVASLSLPLLQASRLPSMTPRQAAYLVIKKPENRHDEETEFLARLTTEVPALTVALDLAGQFLTMLRDRRWEDFDNWLFEAATSSFEPFRSFAKSLSQDYSAVKAGLTLDISNGPVEGLNNRLKMLKRQMYGRAGLDLLSKRLILAQ